MQTRVSVPRVPAVTSRVGAQHERILRQQAARTVKSASSSPAAFSITTRRGPVVCRASSSSPGPIRSLFNLEDIAKPFISAKDTLNEGIASFYDESSGLWEDVWGEHMHHGYYPGGQPRDDHVQAQVDMIERSLEWAGLEASVSGVDQILDVGCGIGGSSRHMARRWPGCVTRGITLSPVQARRANELAREQGLENRSTFQVADALNQPFDDSSFDLVWSMESGEHMPDKGKFVNELARVCAPGGRILIVTWCHRILREGEKTLPDDELQLLDRICEGYYLPRWCSVAEYARLCADEGLVDVKTADWSEQVSPFWRAVIRTALTWRGFVGLLRAGPATVRGGLVMPLMHQGLRRGTIRFNLITATKPR